MHKLPLDPYSLGEEDQPQPRDAGEDWGVLLTPLSQVELSQFGWLRVSDPKDKV